MATMLSPFSPFSRKRLIGTKTKIDREISYGVTDVKRVRLELKTTICSAVLNELMKEAVTRGYLC